MSVTMMKSIRRMGRRRDAIVITNYEAVVLVLGKRKTYLSRFHGRGLGKVWWFRICEAGTARPRCNLGILFIGYLCIAIPILEGWNETSFRHMNRTWQIRTGRVERSFTARRSIEWLLRGS